MNPYKILIVDDEENILWVLKKGLEKNNYIVDTATSGEKALEQLQKNKYLMMFSDIFMELFQSFFPAGCRIDNVIIFLQAFFQDPENIFFIIDNENFMWFHFIILLPLPDWKKNLYGGS